MKISPVLPAILAAWALEVSAQISEKWHPQASATKEALFDVHFPVRDVGYCVGDKGTILKTSDGGETWDSLNSGTDKTLYTVQFVDTAIGFVAGLSGVILSTSDGGRTWVPQSSGSSAALEDLNMVNAEVGYAVGGGGTLLKTVNGGKVWTILPLGVTTRLNAVNFINPDTGYVIGEGDYLNNFVRYTFDGGATWKQSLSVTGTSLRSIQFTSRDTGHMVGNGSFTAMYKTTDAGTSWEYYNKSVPGHAVPSFTTLNSVDFADSKVGYAAGGEYVAGWSARNALVKTLDGGEIWDSIPMPTATPLFAVDAPDANTAYAVGDLGLILSTRGFPPPAPAPIHPGKADTGVSFRPTFQWRYIGPLTTYRLQIAQDSLFAVNVYDDSAILSPPRWVGTLLQDRQYFWRVRAKNSGGTGNWSEIRSFTTFALKAPVPLSPVHQAVDVADNASLTWDVVDSALSYHLQVATDSGFTSLLANDSTSPYSVPVRARNTVYYWRVRAMGGGPGPWSETMTFKTVPPVPAVVVLTSPANGSSFQSINPRLTWNASTWATRYRIRASTRPDLATPVLDDSTVTEISFAVGPLALGTTFYWSVQALNAGGASASSPIWSFTTATPLPGPPQLSSPANESMGASWNPLLTWNAVTGSSNYHMQVSRESSFSAPVAEDSALTGIFKSIGPLEADARYFWRVRAKNGGGATPWSDAWSFTTLPHAPAQPILVSPYDGMVGVPMAPLLTWNAAPAAKFYQVQVSLSAGFDPLVYGKDSLADTSVLIPSVGANTAHFWRVRAANSGGYGAWSPVRTFKTGVTTFIRAMRGGIPREVDLAYRRGAGIHGFDLAIPSSSPVQLTVHGPRGGRGATLVNQWLSPGHYLVEWPGASAPGMFFCRLRAGGKIKTIRVTPL